jgi:phosphoglycerate kinase
MNKMTVRDIDLKGKRVLMRVDFNVPLDGDRITDDTRIRAAVPTLKYILSQKPASIALMSHLGRPKGGPDPKYSLKPAAPALEALLGVPVLFASATVGAETEALVANAPDGAVILLENTRFYPTEEKNDLELAKQMAKLGDVFVMDAFGSAHRAHSSTVGVTQFLPSVAGFLMEKEIDYLANAVENPKRPFVAILGGAKVSDKIAVIEALLSKADRVLIGGGMANTFFKARGYELGSSLVEPDAVETAKALLAKGGDKLVLPVDGVIGDKFADDSQAKPIAVGDSVAEGWSIYDIGPKTVELFAKMLSDAQTIVWNGPMGVFEKQPFKPGTQAVARLVAERTKAGAVSIIGGGDSVAAIEDAGLADQITHISTGGGASLEMLEGKVLPGVAALKDR